MAIYKSWCTERKSSRQPQAFTTAYEPFSMPELMLYIYSRGPDNRANGFAALRWIGAKNGYHIDPCVAVPGSPRGISDLLLFSAMALLRRAGVSHLSFGCEPFEQIGEISGMMKPMKRLTRLCYRFTFQRLPLSGKRAYHEKFRPDDVQDSALFLLFPSGVPDPRQVIALVHTANISVRKLIFGEVTSVSKRLYLSQSRVRTMNLFSKSPPNPEHSS
ncbi:protein ergS [Aspergillus lucknowensis]|uniref:Phosphatidylglycerol lysyltransferase C-terminal domain-containing protein n=1 Tax=Aspergillus lucknowensis TaxID=176173 RepID=A0ABR4M0L9_9EURO